MEVSSHALAQHRADGISLRRRGVHEPHAGSPRLPRHDGGVLASAKARLFTELAPARARDQRRRSVRRDARRAARAAAVIRCSRRPDADAELRASYVVDRSLAADARARRVATAAAIEVRSPLVGAHNLENLLVAVGACARARARRLGDRASALRSAKGAPGRLERVEDPRDVAVLVDYAHTPDALANVLDALRPLTPGRLICVFGCGGDRDRGKRPLMGEAAADARRPRRRDERQSAHRGALATFCRRSSRASRDAGCPRSTRALSARRSRGYVVEVDRAQAIELALARRAPGDTVLVAGKGHEDYQIIGTDEASLRRSRRGPRASLARAIGGEGLMATPIPTNRARSRSTSSRSRVAAARVRGEAARALVSGS